MTTTTIVGNLADSPELKFLPSGIAVANLTVVVNQRIKQGDQWVDGDAMFVNCAVWRDAAENVVESLQKGTRVIVQGRLKTRNWEAKDGRKGTSIEMDVDAIGPELRWATAKVTRTQSGGQSGAQGGTQQGGQRQQGDSWSGSQGGQRPSDPWSQAQSNDEPPF